MLAFSYIRFVVAVAVVVVVGVTFNQKLVQKNFDISTMVYGITVRLTCMRALVVAIDSIRKYTH